MNKFFILKDNCLGKKLFFALICLVNITVYAPSLQHIPRGDHLGYLAHINQQTDWYSLVFGKLTLNRESKISDGDTWLFRPFLYAFLGIEQLLFGYSFFWWQLGGIILHLIFLWCFWQVLVCIKDDSKALWVTAFFSVMPVIMDLVIWTHINGYLIALILMFLSIRNGLFFIDKRISLKRMLITNSLMLTIAAFFCEFTVVMTVVFMIYLYNACPKERIERRWIGMLVIPIIIYLVLNGINWLLTYASSISTQGVYEIKVENLLQGIKSFPVVFIRWLMLGVFPFQFQFYFFDERYMITSLKYFNPLTLLNGILLIQTIFIIKDSLWIFRNNDRLRKMVFFFGGVSLLLCLVFALFRIGPRTLGYLKQSLYWAYIFWSFIMVGFYILMVNSHFWDKANYQLFKKISLLVCVLTIGIYGWIDYKILALRANEDASSRKLIGLIEVAKKRNRVNELNLKQLIHDPGNRQYDFFGNRTLVHMLYPALPWPTNDFVDKNGL